MLSKTTTIIFILLTLTCLQTTKASIIVGTVLLERNDTLDLQNMLVDLEKFWFQEIEKVEYRNEVTMITTNGYTVAITQIFKPAIGMGIEDALSHNYLWNNVSSEISNHQGHIMITLMNAGTNPIQENIIFSKIAAVILKNTPSLGVFLRSRSLLISKEYYLNRVESMNADLLPIDLWIHFGRREHSTTNSAFTIGLKEFYKTEMEIVYSDKSMEELLVFIQMVVDYVISNDVYLRDGESIVLDSANKVNIAISNGEHLEGTTLKIDY